MLNDNLNPQNRQVAASASRLRHALRQWWIATQRVRNQDTRLGHLPDADDYIDYATEHAPEGKENALAIGITLMSSAQIRSENKGIAVENTHWLNDGLWTLRAIEV